MAADYHSLMRRTVSELQPDTEDARRRLYARARHKLDEALAELDGPAEELNAERAALEAAIARIETEMPCRRAPHGGDGAVPARAVPERRTAALPATPAAPQVPSAPRAPRGREPVPAPPKGARPAFPSARSGGIAVAAGAVVLILAGATFLWLKRSPGAVDHPSNPETPAATVAERFAAPPVTAPPPPENRDASVKDSSARSQLSYVYRRQSVFYRTTEPAGTVIIDKPQHFLYVVEPNNVAIRYGIGVGDVCVDIGGLLRVSNKTEWPAWSPSNEGIKQERQPVKVIAGGVDNPLGARALYMGDDAHSIHGTNAPESVGGSIPYGCIGLANDQVIDLYGRIPVGTKVVARN